MEIRRTTEADIPCLKAIFGVARQFMVATGNPHQWAEDYPSRAQLMEDIERRESYVCVADGEVVGTFVMRQGDDPTYACIYDGQWLRQAPYVTIHRIASGMKVKGLFRAVMDFALHEGLDIRIDTHRDNVVMQHLVEQAGFAYCGIIHCWNGDERLAYQRIFPEQNKS